MKPKKSLFDSPQAEARSEARSEARAEADVRAGRVISHEAVRRWLSSWGGAKRLPRPRVGD
jgi:predicted transcriptional regulator